jgi:hypothetical protein
MNDEQHFTQNEERQLQQTENRLDELQRQLEHARDRAEQAEKNLRKHGSPPESMQISEGSDERPHRPGQG